MAYVARASHVFIRANDIHFIVMFFSYDSIEISKDFEISDDFNLWILTFFPLYETELLLKENESSWKKNKSVKKVRIH